MEQILGILSKFSLEFYIIISIIFFFYLIVLLVNLSTRKRIIRLERKYNRFMEGLGEKNIEKMLLDYISMVRDVKDENRDIKMAINTLERNALSHIQRVGIIRYNAFDNVGSDLSFAIALLDGNDDGFVLNGIYTRENSCTYAKPIIGGKSKYTLSAEEIQAIDMAKKSMSR